MRRGFIAAILLLALAGCGEKTDRLSKGPTTHPADPLDIAYAANVSRFFAAGRSPDVTARMLIIPSEVLVGLRQGPAGPTIFTMEARASIWEFTEIQDRRRRGKKLSPILLQESATLPARIEDIPVTHCSAPIDKISAHRIERAWTVMLSDVAPASEEGFGLDGFDFNFEMPAADGGTRSGMTWSPRSTNQTGRLALLGQSMRRYCKQPRPSWLAVMTALADRIAMTTLADRIVPGR